MADLIRDMEMYLSKSANCGSLPMGDMSLPDWRWAFKLKLGQRRQRMSGVFRLGHLGCALNEQ
jgi:hypothetical protein